MAAPKGEKLLWDSPDFAKMYKTAENFMGPYAQMLLDRTDLASKAEGYDKLSIIDMACGTGVVSARVMEQLSDNAKGKLELTCADFSDAMVDSISKRIEVSGWHQAKAVKADAQDTKFPSSKYTHILFNFGPFLIPDPYKALKECHRLLQPDGYLAFSTWQRVGWLDDVREAFSSNPDLPTMPPDEEMIQAFSNTPERWDRVGDVEKHLKVNGFVDVQVKTVSRKTTTETVDEFVGMFPGTLGMLFQKFWTEDERQKHSEAAKKTVVEYTRKKYGDKPIVWDWTAIIASGKKPK